MNKLLAISPLDGRYANKTEALSPIFSEFGLIKHRVAVEVAWLLALCACPEIPEATTLSTEESELLNNLVENFNEADAERIKTIERTTNHDVKAVEYFLKEKIADTSLEPLTEFLHFACTSEDINNLSHALQLKEGLQVITAYQQEIIEKLATMAHEFHGISMLARTHGQTASPTTVGKELSVFVHRLRRQSLCIQEVALLGKLNGAVGNYNAHYATYPDVNWPALSKAVIEDKLGLTQNNYTIQIEPHDYMAEVFHAISRWNTILLDLDRDIWAYISRGYFGQKVIKGEVGSSTMPHKVNPIDFENSEGNVGLANALFNHLAQKLPVSRLQRDLTDSTVIRNVGVAFGYSMVAYQSTLKGLSKLKLNQSTLESDLDSAWEVMAEPIQTIMRKAGVPNAYEKLKDFSRGRKITSDTVRNFIDSLDIAKGDKQRLLMMTPSSYIGIASQLATEI